MRCAAPDLGGVHLPARRLGAPTPHL